MKRLLIFSMGIVVTIPICAQTVVNRSFSLPFPISYTLQTGVSASARTMMRNANVIEKVNYRKITYSYTSKKGESKTVTEYNENGMPTEKRFINTKGESIPSWEISYNHFGDYKSAKFYRKGKLSGSAAYEYDENGTPMAKIDYNRNGRQDHKEQRVYDENGCLTNVLFYDKRDHPSYSWKYEYQSGCEMTHFYSYNSRGKLKAHYDYSCQQDGERIKTSANREKSICRFEAVEGDYLVETKESTSTKGRVTRTILKYSLPDTSLIESKHYDHKGRLRQHQTYDGGYTRLISHRYYSSRGKLISGIDRQYDDEGRLVRDGSFHKDKQQSAYEYEYNDESYLTTIKRYYENQLRSTTSVTYEM